MPRISTFYGIVVYMYYFDDARHKLPHIHVMYQGQEAIFSLLDGALLSGRMPAGKLKLVEAWMEIHKVELVENWNLASRGRVPYPVDPLR